MSMGSTQTPPVRPSRSSFRLPGRSAPPPPTDLVLEPDNPISNYTIPRISYAPPLEPTTASGRYDPNPDPSAQAPKPIAMLTRAHTFGPHSLQAPHAPHTQAQRASLPPRQRSLTVTRDPHQRTGSWGSSSSTSAYHALIPEHTPNLVVPEEPEDEDGDAFLAYASTSNSASSSTAALEVDGDDPAPTLTFSALAYTSSRESLRPPTEDRRRCSIIATTPTVGRKAKCHYDPFARRRILRRAEDAGSKRHSEDSASASVLSGASAVFAEDSGWAVAPREGDAQSTRSGRSAYSGASVHREGVRI